MEKYRPECELNCTDNTEINVEASASKSLQDPQFPLPLEPLSLQHQSTAIVTEYQR